MTQIISTSLPQLPLRDMADRHSGLTPSVANSYIEAASVCLSRHHTSPITILIQKESKVTQAVATWGAVDERTRNAWANESDATRDGAYACALAAVELTANMVAVRRAETLTGADYYIGPQGQVVEDLENCLRLEVSGVDRGNDTIITQRVKKKIEQAAVGRSNLPAMACVVGFQAGKIVLRFVEAV